MKFADGRIEDRKMTIIPKRGEIMIRKASLVHIPKWVITFKAKEFIYARKILAASNTKLMDELEYCPKHFSRWKVWEGKRSNNKSLNFSIFTQPAKGLLHLQKSIQLQLMQLIFHWKMEY